MNQNFWKKNIPIYVFNVIIISITSLVILGYIVGTFIITKRYKKLQGCMEKISKGDALVEEFKKDIPVKKDNKHFKWWYLIIIILIGVLIGVLLISLID